MSYSFRKKNEYDETEVFVRSSDDDLINIVMTFREFLLGCGFHINSVNEYVPDPYEVVREDPDEAFVPMEGANL